MGLGSRKKPCAGHEPNLSGRRIQFVFSWQIIGIRYVYINRSQNMFKLFRTYVSFLEENRNCYVRVTNSNYVLTVYVIITIINYYYRRAKKTRFKFDFFLFNWTYVRALIYYFVRRRSKLWFSNVNYHLSPPDIKNKTKQTINDFIFMLERTYTR